MVLLLAELSGEHPGLAAAEIAGALRALGPSPGDLQREGRILLAETSVGARRLAQRVALAHRVDEVLLWGKLKELMTRAPGLELPPGSFAVRVVDLGGSPSPPGLAGRLGALLGRRHPVDLANPDTEVRVVQGVSATYLTLLRATIDRSAYGARRVALRPFSQPISLHPRLARALVNLTGVVRGQPLADPFCGTGGILLEAGLVGARPLGLDIRQEAVKGTAKTLEAFGVKGDLRVGDVGELPTWAGKLAAIATDPPYGRSTTTRGEPLVLLYRRAFMAMAEALVPGGRAAVVLPDLSYVELAASHLQLLEAFRLRVHRSLSRHFCLFQRPP